MQFPVHPEEYQEAIIHFFVQIRHLFIQEIMVQLVEQYIVRGLWAVQTPTKNVYTESTRMVILLIVLLEVSSERITHFYAYKCF